MIDKLIQDAKAANDVLSLKRVMIAALGEMKKTASTPKPKPSAKSKDDGGSKPSSHKTGY